MNTSSEIKNRQTYPRRPLGRGPQVFDERIDVELGDDDDEQAAGRFVASVLADMGLT